MALFGSASLETTFGTKSGSISDILKQLVDMTGTQDTSKSSTQNTTASQTTAGSGTSVGTQTGSQATKSVSDQQSQQSATALDSASLDKLRTSFQGLLDLSPSSAGGAGQRLAEASGAVSNFNLDSFVNDQVTAAATSLGNQREAATNQMFGAVGGSSGGNTMAALLEGRLAADEASTLAGIKAQATKTGVDTLTELLSGLGAATDSITGQQQALGGLLKGAETVQTGSQTGSQSQAGTTEQQTAAQTTEQQAQQSQQMTSLQESITELLKQLTSTDANRQTESKEKSKEIKASASFGF